MNIAETMKDLNEADARFMLRFLNFVYWFQHNDPKAKG